MKNVLICFLLLAAALPADAIDNKDKPLDLTGYWKEARRISPRNERLDFTDTTYYEFMIGNEYTTQRRTGFMWRGSYKATKTMLDLGNRMYIVLEMSSNRMVLKDDGGRYEFVRYDKAAAAATNNSAASSGNRGSKEDISSSQVTTAQLNGKWEVYKRTSSVTMSSIDYTRIIRVINVKATGINVEGSVGSAKDMENSPSWKIAKYTGGILYCTGRDDRQLKVLQCSNGELVVQEGTLTYFFKQF